LYILVDSIEDLSFLNQELTLKPYLAVDTEFRRTSKENMKLALLQINDGEETYLVDTLAIRDPKEHVSFLFTDKVIKIFHSCKEDIEAIYKWTKEEMRGIYDTQLANALLNGDYSISYQRLVENELGIILEKKETRSNWLRRPLSDAQLKYSI
jgi:ribonuclease D